MPQNKKRDIEFRRVQIAEMYLKCIPQFKIAEKLGVTPGQISRDIKKILEKWQNTAIHDIGIIKTRELEKLNKIEEEAWDAWRRSCEEKTKKSIKKRTSSGSEQKEQSQIMEEMIGDPRWMEIILKCISKREEILGYGAARKLDIKSDGEKISTAAVIILPSNGREIKNSD